MRSPVHAADPHGDVVVAECGATGYILPDASLTPEEFDFAFPGSPCIDCLECLERLREASTVVRERADA